MTIAATIQAAEIQANATSKATVIAACIGGFSIFLGVIASWYTALHLQKVARLSETRKEVYLEFFETYTFMTSEIKLMLDKLNEKWPDFNKCVFSLNNKMNKVLFICETKNKESLYIYSVLLVEKINEFVNEIKPLADLKIEHSRLLEDLNQLKIQEHEIVLKNERTKFNGDNQIREKNENDYLNVLQEKIVDLESSIIQIASRLNSLQIGKREYINQLVKTLNEGFMPLSHKLRTELGAKTDIELDHKIYSKYANK